MRSSTDLIDREIPIYGVTTGFGDSAHRQIAPEKAAQLQQNMLRFLGAGTGQIASPEVTRLTMLFRANCLAKGNSGVRMELIERLLTLLNHDILPLIPERGSCGASGDLVPLSYVGRALVGETEVLYEGAVREALDVIGELGLEPLVLEAKEGLALTNGTSFMSGFATLAVHDARELAFVVDLCTAMASQALMGNHGHFNDFLFEAKPHPGILESASNIRMLLEGSGLTHDAEEIVPLGRRRLPRAHPLGAGQVLDPLRPAHHGALRDTLTWLDRWVEIEINSSDDNPLFDVGAGRVQSGGNFYGSHMAQGMDSLKIALANMCDLMDRQLELVVDEKFNAGLTPNLIPYFEPTDHEAGLHHGFKGMQLSCSALTAEALKMCNPASIHSRSTEAHNQDKVSMGTIAARDARTIVEIAQNIAAIHLIALAQALELRGIEQASPKVREAHALVRARVAFLDARSAHGPRHRRGRRAHPLGRAFRGPGVGGVARGGPRLGGSSLAHWISRRSAVPGAGGARRRCAVRRSAPGSRPDVAVDAAGVAYIAWTGAETGNPAHFCRLPRGAAACDVASVLPPPAGATGSTTRPVVQVTGARVSVLHYTLRAVEPDHALPVDRRGRDVRVADRRRERPDLRARRTGRATRSRSSPAPTGAARCSRTCRWPAAPRRDVRHAGRHAAVLRRGRSRWRGRRVVIAENGASIGAFRRLRRAATPTPTANWSAPVDIGYLDYPRLAGGPLGLFVLAGDEAGGMFVRRFDGTTFGARVAIAPGDASRVGALPGRRRAACTRSTRGWTRPATTRCTRSPTTA